MKNNLNRLIVFDSIYGANHLETSKGKIYLAHFQAML